MPIHDWTRVDAGIFHAFHHDWITEITRSLNRGILPEEYSALPEPCAAGFGPAVLTLEKEREAGEEVPLEPTYQAAFEKMPRRWRSVLVP